MRIICLILMFSAIWAACNSRTAHFQAQDAENKFYSPTVEADQNRKVNKTANSVKKPEEKMTEVSENSPLTTVSLKATAEKTENELLIKYEVENHSDRNLYLWDGMIGFDGQGQRIIDHDLAYVFYEEQNTVRVMRAVLPLPTIRSVGKKEIPFVREFPAKSKLEGSIKLKLPVEEFSPYFEPLKEENSENVKCNQIRLIIGWTPFREGMNITERTVGKDKVFAIRGAWSPPYQQIVEKKIPIDVNLLIYKDEFERQMPLK